MKPITKNAISFIPKRLELTEKPELNVFPYNVLIAREFLNKYGTLMLAYVLYEPDLSNIKNKKNAKTINYYNIYNKNFRLEITYNTEYNFYFCKKVEGKKWLCITSDEDWKEFFIVIGSFGLAKGETCMFKELLNTN